MDEEHKQLRLAHDKALADLARLQKVHRERLAEQEDLVATLKREHKLAEAQLREGAVAAEAAHEEQGRKLRKELREAAEKHQEKMTALQAKLDLVVKKSEEQAHLIVALGGTELGRSLQQENHRRRLAETIAKAQKELRALEV